MSWALILVSLTACGPVPPSPALLPPPYADSAADQRACDSQGLITRAEIAPKMLSKVPGVRSAYDVVMYRCPGWLQAPGMSTSNQASPAAPLVYVEGVHYGNFEMLKTIAANDVAELRFLDARAATMRFGPAHMSAVILVRLRR